MLTQSGWKQIGEVNEEAIAVWSANKQIKFETPITWNKFNYTGNMLLFNEPELNQLVTPNHRMIFKSNNKIRIEEASVVASMKSLNFPNSGYYVGGTADAKRVEQAFRIILRDPSVKAILINIFGGIVRCDRVAQGVVDAYNTIGNISVPIIVRLQGTNADLAKKIIDESGLEVKSAILLQEAAELVTEVLKGKS